MASSFYQQPDNMVEEEEVEEVEEDDLDQEKLLELCLGRHHCKSLQLGHVEVWTESADKI